MKYFNYILFFLLLSNSLFAQISSNKTKIEWGEELKASKKSSLTDIIGYDETGFYALKEKATGPFSKKSIITIEHFNHDLKQTKSIELDLSKDYDRSFAFFYYSNNKILLFLTENNQQKRQNILYVRELNKKTLTPSKEEKKIAEIQYFGLRNIGYFSANRSADSSKFLFYYKVPKGKYDKESFSLTVMDDNLYQLWQKDITLPYDENLFKTNDFVVDNYGNVHLVGTLFKDKAKEVRKGKPNYKFHILSYRNNGTEFIEYPIEVQGKFITDIQIAINSDKDIICGGFYSREGTESIIGSYFLKINNQTKEVDTKEFQEFGIDFITQNMTEREERKTKKRAAKGKDIELYEYDLDDIVLRDDGGAILIGEQYYVKEVTTTMTSPDGMVSTSTNYYYYYNDIIIVNLSSNGKIDWTKKIAKRQYTSNDNGFYSSYVMAIIDDNLHFIFNDHPANLYIKEGDKIKSFNRKDASVVLVTVNLEGLQSKKALFNAEATGILMRPKVCEQISKNEVILFGQKRKKHQFAKVSFE